MAKAVHEIPLRFDDPSELFSLPSTDEFSEYRNYLTGVEVAISEMKGSSPRPVRLRLNLPAAVVSDGLDERISIALDRYCTNRARYNYNEIRSMRRDGLGAVFIGLAILFVGLFLYQWIQNLSEASDWERLYLGDGIFLVIAWVGMWYPLDTLVYSTRPYSRENRVLARLAAAEIAIESR